MAEIPRKHQKIFGSSLTPTGNVAVWGSLAAGAPAFSNDPDVIQSLSNFGQGFNGEVVGNSSPALEDLNGLMLLVTQQIAYVLQSGLAEWSADTTYWQSNFARIGSTIYLSLTNNNIGNNPATDTNNWAPYFEKATGPTLAAASVVFDGVNATSGNARIISSFNVSTVTKNAAGSYTINFTNALPSANYVVSGTCGSENSQPYGSGDDGAVVGNVSGQGNAVRSASACRVFTIDTTNKTLVESGCVSVVFFALP